MINILYAEDNESDVMLFRLHCKKSRVINPIEIVGNGEEVFQFLEDNESPDLILLDLNMPRMGGLTCLRELKKDDRYRHIPVVMLTTSDKEEDIVKTYQEGGCSFLTKPVQIKDFDQLLKAFGFYWSLVKLP